MMDWVEQQEWKSYYSGQQCKRYRQQASGRRTIERFWLANRGTSALIRRMETEKASRENLSPHPPQFLHRPISKHGLAVDIALIHRTKIAAVVRHGAVIAQHEVGIGRNDRLRIRSRIGVNRGNVIFIHGLVVHIQLAAINADAVSTHSDYALDVALRRIAGIAKHDNVAALNGLQAIDEFVDEDAFLVGQRGHH